MWQRQSVSKLLFVYSASTLMRQAHDVDATLLDILRREYGRASIAVLAALGKLVFTIKSVSCESGISILVLLKI